MPVGSSRNSLRYFTFLFTGGCLVVFAALLFGIFYSVMPRVLLDAENIVLTRQKKTTAALFKGNIRKTFMIADDIASGREIATFARGEYPAYMKSTWPDAPPLETYDFTFLLIKDLNGNDIHQEYFNPDTPGKTGFPPDLSSRLTPIAESVASAKVGNRGPAVMQRGRGGIIFHQGIPYLFATMPITGTISDSKPEGTVTIGSVLDNAYFRNLTRHDMLSFRIIHVDTPVSDTHAHEFPDSKTFRILTPFQDIDGKPLALETTGSRVVYSKGKSLLSNTALLLLAAMALYAVALYAVIVKLVLRPIETLDKDLASVSAAKPLTPGKYSACAEFANLSESINAMVYRIQQSNISIDVFERILSGSDAMLYVTDALTNEILFTNSTMMRHFGFSESVIGQACWKMFQKNQDGPCLFCPVPQLRKNPDIPVIWEEKNPLTGKYYRNTSSLIEWTDGRLAHLQHRVDITDIKLTEADIQKRLEQQEVMSAIAQSFIGKSDTKHMIGNALELCGKFMRASRVLLARSDLGKKLVRFDHEWVNKKEPVESLKGTTVDFSTNAFVHNAFIKKKAAFIAYGDVRGISELAGSPKRRLSALSMCPSIGKENSGACSALRTVMKKERGPKAIFNW